MNPIFHIVPQSTWEAASDTGWYRPESLDVEGFVHCSEADQVAGVADAYYGGRTDLLLLEIDPARLRAKVVREAGSPRQGLFPHVYGPLPVDSVVQVHGLPLGMDGHFHWSADGE